MKFFQKPGVAVIFTIVMIAAALFIGLKVLPADIAHLPALGAHHA